MPRRKNDPAKVQATEEPEGKRVKVDSVSDEKPEEKISNSEADLMNIPVPDEDGVLLICGGTNWSLNGRKKPRKGDGLERTPGSKGPLSSTDGEDILVDFLSRNRSLLSISCAPDVKAAKKSDMESLLRIYHERGVYRTDKQIRKTINNFRTRIKWKTTQSQTGNQRVRLSLQEQKFSDLLGPISVGADEKCNFKSLPGLRKKSSKAPLPPSQKALHLPSPRAPLSATSFSADDTGIEESYMNEHVKNQPPTLASVASLNEITDARFEPAERESIFSHQTNCEMPIPQSANSSRRSLSHEYCSSSMGLDNHGQESLLSRQMELIEMQMKVAGEQFLAAKQQRIYYELKTQQLQSRRMANANFTS